MDLKNLSIIRQTFANTVFTHKVQEIAAENQERKTFYVKIANIVITGVVLVLLVLQTLFPTNQLLIYSAAGVTISEIIFLIIQLSFSFEQRAIAHKNSALKYMGLRDKFRNLITDIMNESIKLDLIISRRDQLQQEYQVICDLSPQTSNEDFKEAQKRLNKAGIVEGEDFTWSDDEIDRFLPESLRLNNEISD